MGIDFRQSRNGKYNRNKWYAAEYVNKMELVAGSEIGGVFYSCDKSPISMTSVVNGLYRKTEYKITIETNDKVDELKCNDYVYYNNQLWLVEEIKAEDVNSNKMFSGRPSFITEIKLRR